MAMIERHVAQQHVERFAGLDWYPREGAAFRELVTAMQTAPSEVIAEIVTSGWIESQREAPKPSDLRHLIYREVERFQQEFPPAPCAICQGTGYIIVERAGLTGAKDCTCRAKFRGPHPETGAACAAEKLAGGNAE
jgi:hypothetical protein